MRRIIQLARQSKGIRYTTILIKKKLPGSCGLEYELIGMAAHIKTHHDQYKTIVETTVEEEQPRTHLFGVFLFILFTVFFVLVCVYTNHTTFNLERPHTTPIYTPVYTPVYTSVFYPANKHTVVQRTVVTNSSTAEEEGDTKNHMSTTYGRTATL